MKLMHIALLLLIAGAMSLFGNTACYKLPLGEAAIGYAIIAALTILGVAVAKIFPFKLPMVFWISIVAVLSTSPISPVAKTITYYTGKVEFLALTTPILAYAGLSIGKDLEAFKKVSWRIVLVALTVFTGTFLFATLVAQIMLKIEGVI